MNRKLLLSITAALIIFTAILAAMVLPLKPTGTILDKGWEMRFESDPAVPAGFPFYLKTDVPSRALFTITPEPSPYTTLTLQWPDVTSLEIYWNDLLIHRIGDSTNPSGSFWNYYHVVELPEQPDGTDTLTLMVTGHFGINFGRSPFLGDRRIIDRRAGLHNFMYDDLLMIFIGAGIFLGIIMIIIPPWDTRLKNSTLYLGAAAIIGCLHFFDYHCIPALPHYVLFKKAFYAAGAVSTLLLCFSLESYYRGRTKYTRFLAIPSIAALANIVILPLTTVSSLLPYLNIVLFLNILTALILVFSYRDKSPYMIVTAAILLFSVVEATAVLLFRLGWPFVIQNAIITAILLYGMQLITFYNEIYQRHKKLSGETIRDPLTQAYNRRSLERIDTNDFSLICVIDLDNFKYYNDTYGHQEGDKLLRNFSAIMIKNLRNDDLVVRYGGDEFILYLKNASPDTGKSIIERIQNDFSQEIKDDKVGFSYGFQNITGNQKDDLKKADQAMYAMKNRKKAPPPNPNEPVRSTT